MSGYQRVSQHEHDNETDTVIEVNEDDDARHQPTTLADIDERQNPPTAVTIVQQKPITTTTNTALSQPPRDADGTLMLSLTLIRQNEPNRRVFASPQWTVHALKLECYPGELKDNKNVRLIYLGRVLQDSQTLKSLEIENDHVIHAMITERLPPTPSSQSSTQPQYNGGEFYQNPSAPAFIHVGNNGATGDDSDLEIDDDHYVNTAQGPVLLSSLTMTQPPEGTSRDFVFGFVLGLVLGFLSLLWLWNSAAPRKQRVGILLGLMCYVVISSLSGQAAANQQRENSHP